MATILTEAGEELVCDLIRGTGTAPSFVGWGTGAGTAAKRDTTLFTESAESRVSGTQTTEGSGATAKYQVVSTITSAGGQTITNAGNFDASSSGNLHIHGDFTGIVLATGDKIEFTITLDPA